MPGTQPSSSGLSNMTSLTTSQSMPTTPSRKRANSGSHDQISDLPLAKKSATSIAANRHLFSSSGEEDCFNLFLQIQDRLLKLKNDCDETYKNVHKVVKLEIAAIFELTQDFVKKSEETALGCVGATHQEVAYESIPAGQVSDPIQLDQIRQILTQALSPITSSLTQLEKKAKETSEALSQQATMLADQKTELEAQKANFATLGSGVGQPSTHSTRPTKPRTQPQPKPTKSFASVLIASSQQNTVEAIEEKLKASLDLQGIQPKIRRLGNKVAIDCAPALADQLKTAIETLDLHPTVPKKPFPVVEFVDYERERDYVTFMKDLTGQHPTIKDDQASLINTKSYAKRSVHRCRVTPALYKELNTLTSDKKKLQTTWHYVPWFLATSTSQCQKCYSWEHGTSKHPQNDEPLCRDCGQPRHQGKPCDNDKPKKCVNCNGTDHRPNHHSCPKAKEILRKDVERYDLDSDISVLPPITRKTPPGSGNPGPSSQS